MEQRKDKRFRERDGVLIKDIGQPEETEGNGATNAHTYDISLSGARICSKQDFPVGYVLRIVIDLKGAQDPLSIDGEVMWSRKNTDSDDYEIGVEFLHDISDTILSLIKHFYGKKVGIPTSVS